MSGTSKPSVVFSFGDSLSDGGDAYIFTASSYASLAGLTALPVSPPYYAEPYTTFGGGQSTAGVFSNGPIWEQDLETLLGIPLTGPGNLGITTTNLTALLEANGYSAFQANIAVQGLEATNPVSGNYITLIQGAANGTNFAIGAGVTGITNFNTSELNAVGDLPAQIQNFSVEYPTPPPNALYTVWGGPDDILNLAFAPNITTLISTGDAALDVSQSASNDVAAVLSLISLGAQNLLVLNAPDVGKAPSVLALGSTASSQATYLAQLFNTDLVSDLAAANLGSATVKIVDTFSLIDNAVSNPGLYNLTNANSSVYTGSFETYTPADIVSTDPTIQNGYLFFDGEHPTEAGQQDTAALAYATLACFAAGTLIHTPSGQRPVETLRPGDCISSMSDASATVKWVGRRYLDLRRHPHPHEAWPILIAAGAIADGVPSRDLMLSPDHALWLYDRLIPAKALCNGHNVRQIELDEITYFHIELAQHDVILANNTPAESYLDTGDRAAFDNGGDIVILHPQFAEPEWCTSRCGRMAEQGPIVERLRQRLLRRADLAPPPISAPAATYGSQRRSA